MYKEKKVIVSLRTDIMPGREQLIGVFRFVKTHGCRWNLVIRTQAELADSFSRGEHADADGYIISEIPPDSVSKSLSSLSSAIVTIDSPPSLISRKAQVVNIELDNAAIGRMGAEHFLKMGRFRSYAFVLAQEERHWSRERAKAFYLALRNRGADCAVYASDSEKSLADWLQDLPKPTAVMVACDRRMITVLEACHTAKIAIPEQLALLGVDNEEMYCNFTEPSLSSVDPGLEAEGFNAAAALSELMQAHKPRPVRKVNFQPLRVIERESTSAVIPAAMMMRKALAFIDGNAANGITATDVVKTLHVSRRLAELRFRQLHGKTIRETIVERRIHLAHSLVTNTQCTIREIIQSCGFTNRRQFERLYKQYFGTAARRTSRD